MPEDMEGGDMLKFIEQLIKGLIDLPPDCNLGIERAHRSLQRKPTNPMDSPRSIVVKFSSFQIKESVPHGAWKKKKLELKEKRIFFSIMITLTHCRTKRENTSRSRNN